MTLKVSGILGGLFVSMSLATYMNNPEAMKEWVEKIQKEFDALPEDK